MITTVFSAFIILFSPYVLAQVVAQEVFVQVGGPKGLSEPAMFPTEMTGLAFRTYTFKASSFTQSGSVSASTAAAGARDKVNTSDITLTKAVGISSLNFQTAMYSGQTLSTVTIDFFNRLAQGTYVQSSQIALANVRVTAVQRTWSPGKEPTDEIKLSFTNIWWSHTPINAQGQPMAPVRVGFDVVTGRVN